MGALVNMQKGGGDGCRRAFSRGLTSLIRRKPVDSVHTRSETRGLARRLSLVDLIAIGIIQTFFFHILDLGLFNFLNYTVFYCICLMGLCYFACIFSKIFFHILLFLCMFMCSYSFLHCSVFNGNC